MSRRAVVLILAGVIAAAVAIPAVADPGPTAVTASVKGLSKRALAKAKDSLRMARAAKRAATRATRTAGDAEDAANAAKSTASAAQAAASAASGSAAGALKAATSAGEKAGGAELNAREAKAEVAATRANIGLAEGAVETESEAFVKLPGGPSVTVTVPPTGLVQVWGSALIDSESSDEGAVSLYEDGHEVEGQAQCDDVKGVLFAAAPVTPGEPILVGTPAGQPGFIGCATLGAPGPVLFRSSAGEHSFEFRYAACPCGPPPTEKVTFSQRRLVVAPLP